MKNLRLSDAEFLMLCKMAERGWSDGDLAEYLDADQIQVCMTVLEKLRLAAPPAATNAK